MTIGTGSTLGGRYTLGPAIAAGGMGTVWEATDDVLQRPVAVKVMRPPVPGDTAFLERFRDEARGSASLHHPTIATVFDYGEEEGTAYLVMELVPGRTVGELVLEHPAGMPADEVRSILGQAAVALSVAHDAGVVHRDVKPANIIVTPEGQAKLTDFGIARVGDGSGHTITGEVLGTPDYLSPEQALGEPATTASDLYSLGVVAHEMLTGRKPFDRGTPVATAIAQVNEEAPPLPASVPADLRAVIEASLAKSPADRPADARAVAVAAGVPLGALPGLTHTPGAEPGGAEATTVLAVEAVAPTRALTVPTPDLSRAQIRAGRRGGEGSPSTRAHSVRLRWGWVAVPAVALAVWGAFAVGNLMASPDATPPAGSATASSPTPPASKTPTPSTSTRTGTTPTTTRATPTKLATATHEPSKPGKGKGKGKGN